MQEGEVAFRKGVQSFGAGEYELALTQFSAALRLEYDTCRALDSRAAVYQKLGRSKEALADARKLINTLPTRWQGYARAARSFQTIKKPDSALTMVDLALERLNPAQSKIHQELITLRESIKQDIEQQSEWARKTFCHVGNLPVEILFAIFMLIVEECPWNVISLSTVCQHWRRVAIDSPALWSALSMRSHLQKRPVAKAKLWTERSRGMIKSLVLEDYIACKHAADFDDIWHQPLTSLKSLTLHNVKSLSTYLKRPMFQGLVLANLESLELTPVDDCLQIEHYPHLQWRRLNVEFGSLDWPHLADRCVELRDLQFDGPFRDDEYPDLLWLLHRNANLETLSLKFTYGQMRHARPIPRTLPASIQLPHLMRLSLGGEDMKALKIVPRLSLPRLVSLHLTRLTGNLDGILQHLLSMSAIVHLEELVIDRCPIGNVSLVIDILRVATDLQSIRMTHIANGGEVLEALASPLPPNDLPQNPDLNPTNTNVLCPRLTSVDFSHCPDVRDGSLIRLTKARNGATPTGAIDEVASAEAVVNTPISRLRSVVIDGCDKVDASILPWMRKLVPRVDCVYATRKQARWKR